jgi:Ca2+-binding RTX toxin-like protein
MDVVYASTSFRLPAGLERLVLLSPMGLVGTGNAGANEILGDVGDDVIWGLGGNDALNGAEGNNRLMGGVGLDTLRGGDGNDRLDGGAGADVVYAGYGNDTLLGAGGRDVLRFDELTGLSGVTVTLATNKAIFEDQGDIFRFSGFEDLFGSAYGDTLTGNALANTLSGGGGADTLLAGAGDDSLVGGAQADVMDGGLGADVFVYTVLSDSRASAADTIQGFDKAQDRIDLSMLDAVPGGADDLFSFIGNQAFGGSGACLRYEHNAAAGTTLIELRLPGSTSDDLQIVLTGLYDLTTANFVL